MSYVEQHTLRLRLHLLPSASLPPPPLDVSPLCEYTRALSGSVSPFRSSLLVSFDGPFRSQPPSRKRAGVGERGTTHRASQITPLSERADLSVRYTPRCSVERNLPFASTDSLSSFRRSSSLSSRAHTVGSPPISLSPPARRRRRRCLPCRRRLSFSPPRLLARLPNSRTS